MSTREAMSSTADLPRQARVQSLIGRLRIVAVDGSWTMFLKILQRLPEELESLALAAKQAEDHVHRLEAELAALRQENELLRLSRPLPPPPLPPPLPSHRDEAAQVEDIDIEALEDVFSEHDPPELRQITRDFIAGINQLIAQRKEKK